MPYGHQTCGVEIVSGNETVLVWPADRLTSWLKSWLKSCAPTLPETVAVTADEERLRASTLTVSEAESSAPLSEVTTCAQESDTAPLRRTTMSRSRPMFL